MKLSKNTFLKKWVTGNLAVYSGALGLFHPLIAHGFTGAHDKLLTTPQFIMHTLSLFVFVFFLVRMQNKTFQIAGRRETLAGIWPFLFITPWVFWLGYYTLFVPFDILFMFLSIGIINAIQLKPLVKFPGKWARQCILVYFLAAVAGIIIGLGAYSFTIKTCRELRGIWPPGYQSVFLPRSLLPIASGTSWQSRSSCPKIMSLIFPGRKANFIKLPESAR